MDDCNKSFISHLAHRGILAYILLTLIVSCSKAPQASKEIIIRLPALGSMRALGTNYGMGNVFSDPHEIGQTDISSVEIHFWDISKRVEVQPAVTFSANSREIAQLKTPSGYKIAVPSRCEAISVVCNPERLSNNILDYQGRTITEMPLLSDRVSIQRRPNGLTVELDPKPPVARLEVVSGVSSGSYVVAGGEIKNVRITGLYINNYIKDRSTGERSNLSYIDYFPSSSGGFWFGHEQKMHNLENTLHDKLLQYDRQTGRNSYADFYYVFPRTEESPSSIDHLIIRLDYDKNGQRYTNRFITIQSYLVKGATGPGRLARFEAGRNYNINLSLVFSQFTSDNDPTSDKPEVPFINVEGVVETPGETSPITDESTEGD